MTPELSNESKPGCGLKAKRKRKPKANEPKIDLAGLLERICGIDLTKVVGLNVLNVLLIVSEIGVDMSKWRSAKAFCSWLGLCPGNKISGGKVLDSRTRQVVNRVADALRLAAQSVGRTETCLGIFYRRKLAHLGAPKATTATARKLACLIYHLLKHKQPYQEPDPAIYRAGLFREALHEIYIPRIQRGDSSFAANVLGARGPLLSALVHFFEHGRWGSLVETGVEGQSLNTEDHLYILMQAALHLTVTRGFAAPEARICYELAEPLCHSLGIHALLFGRVRDRATIRETWCSDLALGERPVSGGRVLHASRRLPDLWGHVRVASRRDRLLPRDDG